LHKQTVNGFGISSEFSFLHDLIPKIYIPAGILCLLRSTYTTLGLCMRHWSKKECVYFESTLGYHQNTLYLQTGTPPIQHTQREWKRERF